MEMYSEQQAHNDIAKIVAALFSGIQPSMIGEVEDIGNTAKTGVCKTMALAEKGTLYGNKAQTKHKHNTLCNVV